MEKQGIALRNSIIGSLIRIGFVYFCVPPFGIRGYIWGYAVSGALVSVLNLYTVIKVTGLTLDFRNWLIKPGLVCGFMVLTGKYIYSFCTLFSDSQKLTIVLALLVNIGVAVALMVVVGVLRRDDLAKLFRFRKAAAARK
jgi:stage V sporulation protein B